MNAPSKINPLVALISVALVLRLIAASYLHYDKPDRFLFGDSDTYWTLAGSLAQGGPYRYGSDQGWIMRMPGYPLFLTGIIAPCLAVWPLDRPEDNVLFLTPLVPQHLLIARLIHAVLGTLTVYLVYLLAKILRNRKTALCAAAMAACYPPFILFSVVILSETLFSVFLLLQLLVTLKIIQLCKAEPTIKQRWRLTFLIFISGILWGLATLTRASWLLSGLLIIPLLFSIWLKKHKSEPGDSRRLPILTPFIILLAFCLTMMPWWVRNWKITGSFVPTTLWVGASLYDGLNPEATGASDMTFMTNTKRNELTETELDHHFQTQALEFALNNPTRVIDLMRIKLARFWNFQPNTAMFNHFFVNGIFSIAYLSVVVLGLIGIWKHREHRYTLFLLLLPLAYFCLLHLVFVSSLRYRLPGMYPWMVLAASAMVPGRVSRWDQTRTRDVYGRLWTYYGPIRPEQDKSTFIEKTGYHPEQLKDWSVLDAGCGSGRYLRVASQEGAHVTGIDLSPSVFRAQELIVDQKTDLVQGDLLCPPFKPETFDLIYSIGVLEHTPDARKAFRELVKLLRPGGHLVIWLHPKWRVELEWLDFLQRSITSRLPIFMLIGLSRICVPLGGFKRRLTLSTWSLFRRMGLLIHVFTLGVSLHPDPATRLCDTFNWYAPRWRSHHTETEVKQWFHDSGMVDIENRHMTQKHFHTGQGDGINLAGRRPDAVSSK